MNNYDEFTVKEYLSKKKKANTEYKKQIKKDIEDIKSINKQKDHIDKEALESTHHSIRVLREAEYVGTKDLDELNRQGEVLDKTSEKIQQADVNAEKDYREASKVKKYDKIFNLNFLRFSHHKKKDADKKYKKAKDEINDRKKKVEEEKTKLHNLKVKKYKSEPKQERTETENEIDQNLSDMSNVLDNLKLIQLKMGQEMDRQNLVMDEIDKTGQHVSAVLERADKKIQKFT